MTEARIELPPLPEPDGFGISEEGVDDGRYWYTSKMREYARAAVLSERERCARVCEVWAAEDMPGAVLGRTLRLAAAIRKGD